MKRKRREFSHYPNNQKNKAFWTLAANQGLAFVHWLKAFKVIGDGYASGNFIYGLMVAEKP
jgi:hypothetical protein